MDILSDFLNLNDAAGRYVSVCPQGVWTVCDLLERRVVARLPTTEADEWWVRFWRADVKRDRAYMPRRGEMRCCRLSDGVQLWQQEIDNIDDGVFQIHPATGDLLVEESYVVRREAQSGLLSHKAVPDRTIDAYIHPSRSTLLYCRLEDLPPSNHTKESGRQGVFEFHHEDTGARVISSTHWTDDVGFGWMHGDYAFARGISKGRMKCLNIHTGKLIWEERISAIAGGYHEGLGCLVFKIGGGYKLIVHISPETGEELKEMDIPESWEQCFVNNNTQLLTFDGRLFDTENLELIEENVFARMGVSLSCP